MSGKSIRGLLNYNENKVSINQASLILANKFGAELDKLDFKSKLNRFEHLTCLNSRVKTNAIHIMLNFDRGDKLTPSILQQIANAYMKRIGFEDQPFLVYSHKDASHPHIHIVTTNLQSDGKRISIHNIGKILSEPARRQLENEFNLVKAEGRKHSEQIIAPINIEKALYSKTPTKQAINNVVNGVLNTYKFTSFGEYNAVLGQFGVKADRGKEDTVMFEKRGLIYSVIDKQGKAVGIPFKASVLSNKPLLDKVESKFDINKEKRKPFYDGLKNQIGSVLQRYDDITLNTFVRELEKKDIAVVFRRNEQGFIYGVTFIDHQNKTVFNGSALGKEYSAKQLSERFSDSDKLKSFLSPVQVPKTFIKPLGENPLKSYLTPAGQTNYLNRLLGKPQVEGGSPIPKQKKRKRAGRTL